VHGKKGMMLLSICPLCNGLQQLSLPCKRCRAMLVDMGKVTDYLDDYSAYEEQDTLKQVDGLKTSIENDLCLHLFFCQHCGWEEHIIINE